MNRLLKTCIFLLFAIIMSNTPMTAISAPVGFTARLIHRSSPLSPFYDPKKSFDVMVSEEHQIFELRARVNTTLDTSLRYRPASLDYVLEFSIGNPGIKAFAIADTGSSINWLQCATCEVCFDQESARFDPSKSSTYKPITCNDPACATFRCQKSSCIYYVSYIKGPQNSGEVARETFTFQEGDLTTKTYSGIIFGCGIQNFNDESLSGMGGIIGIGHSKLSFLRQTNITKFSFCQSENKIHDSFIKFGDYSDIWGDKTLLLLNEKGHYQLILDGIDVNTTPINVSSSVFDVYNDSKNGCLLDTGAGYSYLQSEIIEALYAAVKLYVSSEPTRSDQWQLCYQKIGGSYVDMLPEITFNFRYLSMRLPFTSTWVRDVADGYCLAIGKSPRAYSIFGMYQMRGFNMGVDLLNSEVSISYEGTCYEFGRRR